MVLSLLLRQDFPQCEASEVRAGSIEKQNIRKGTAKAIAAPLALTTFREQQEVAEPKSSALLGYLVHS